MILIIAEKPSLGRNIAAGIGPMQKRQGYLEGQGYLITWAFGHLFSLCDIEAYNPQPGGSVRWTLDNLPCFPKDFRFELRRGDNKEVDSGVRQQFELIRALCNREDVETVVNAGDADREGEIIVRLCIQNALQKPKRLMRPWRAAHLSACCKAMELPVTSTVAFTPTPPVMALTLSAKSGSLGSRA